MEGPGRLERPTYGFEVRRSIQLSYGPMVHENGGMNSDDATPVSSLFRRYGDILRPKNRP